MRAIAGIECDLVVRGGTVATTGASAECDLGVTDGKIGQLGGTMRGRRETQRAGARAAGRDRHARPPVTVRAAGLRPGWADDFDSGSRAAIAGGVTTSAT